MLIKRNRQVPGDCVISIETLARNQASRERPTYLVSHQFSCPPPRLLSSCAAWLLEFPGFTGDCLVGCCGTWAPRLLAGQVTMQPGSWHGNFSKISHCSSCRTRLFFLNVPAVQNFTLPTFCSHSEQIFSSEIQNFPRERNSGSWTALIVILSLKMGCAATNCQRES